MNLKCNCCDGIYNSFDIHFTRACDNRCAHCIDSRYNCVGKNVPDIDAIVSKILKNINGLDDVLFLGGEPCLYLEKLYECVCRLRELTTLKLYVTTAVPKICYDKRDLFIKLIESLDGINLSVQHYNEFIADQIRRTTSKYDRQEFYNNLPYKEKIRINLNIVKPYLYTKEGLTKCLYHYDKMGFNSIKLSEIQHGTNSFVSFADTFSLKMKSAYAHGCQSYLDMEKILPGFKTPVLLKRSCFACEETLTASLADGVKVLFKMFSRPKNKYAVIYSDGTLTKGWI